MVMDPILPIGSNSDAFASSDSTEGKALPRHKALESGGSSVRWLQADRHPAVVLTFCPQVSMSRVHKLTPPLSSVQTTNDKTRDAKSRARGRRKMGRGPKFQVKFLEVSPRNM